MREKLTSKATPEKTSVEEGKVAEEQQRIKVGR